MLSFSDLPANLVTEFVIMSVFNVLDMTGTYQKKAH